jgi:hypothetical protein
MKLLASLGLLLAAATFTLSASADVAPKKKCSVADTSDAGSNDLAAIACIGGVAVAGVVLRKRRPD